MLIKEYRIPMPMSVEEYRIAQLYMIQVRLAFSDRAITNAAPRTKEFSTREGAGKVAQWRVTRVTVGAGQQRESRRGRRPPANASRGREGCCCPDGAPYARGSDPL